jgi:hypothetical protein
MLEQSGLDVIGSNESQKTVDLPPKPILKSRLYLTAHLQEALGKRLNVRNQSVIDIDRLDRNIGLTRASIPKGISIRLRVASLPNPYLLLYLSHKLSTQKLYVLHPGILFELLSMPQFDEFDIWLGRSLPKSVFDIEFWQKDPQIWDRLAKTVTFQVGSKEELGELIRFAHSIGKKLKVALEFDCGKRRGGFQKIKELEHALKMIQATDGAVVLKGVAASDEHLPLNPVWFSKWFTSLQAQFAKTQSFVLMIKELIRQYGYGSEVAVLGGCSRTLQFHCKGSHLDEFAVGSLFLGPSYIFSDPDFKSFEAAFYVAHPVTHSEKNFKAPFLGTIFSWIYQSVFHRNQIPTWVSGGPWPGVWAHEGVREAPWFFNQKKMARLLPDQSFLWLKLKDSAQKNQALLLVPDDSDLMLLFNESVVIRQGAVLGSWKNFRNTY